MIRFESDYLEGAHPKILEQLMATNFEQTPGYGVDAYCEEAKAYIKAKCKNDQIDVHFLVGGTQTNKTVIASILRPHEGVICAETGHINVHETGAIENTGHKVLALASSDGKLTAREISDYCNRHRLDPTAEHMVKPGMVYISHPTENGTLYTKEELTAISTVCHTLNLPLFLDGARLGYGLTAEGSDLTLEDIAKLCDVFYIGGTKVGMLFGEAVVITQEILKQDFRYLIKQHGGMLAKGRLLGIQFKALFEDDTYFEIARAANEKAMAIKKAFMETGHNFLFDSVTNQQFPILSEEEILALQKEYGFSYWCKVDEKRRAVRFCTSWATTNEQVEKLISSIYALAKD